MKIYKNPPREQWQEIIARPVMDSALLEKSVRKMLNRVKTGGDRAVKKYTRDFDGISMRKLEVPAAEIKEAEKLLSHELKEAIELAASNIRRFHQQQVKEEPAVETMPGVLCWRKPVAIEKVGIYIPGGSAPLFSTILMLAIPAGLAGCSEIVLCSPPGKDGKLHPAILYAAKLTGVTRLFKCGGAQAIAAMAYGTESIPAVYKIFGPGNQYVTCAKQLVQQDGIAIDMPAGPSEVAIYADETCNPAFVAADLLSQAEHGRDSQVLLVASKDAILEEVRVEIDRQLSKLPRKELAAVSLSNSRFVWMEKQADAIALLNAYAAEHLILCCSDPGILADSIRNAGSVFLGNYSPESVGDYASGTNHTLPTNGFARMYSGVSADSFVKKITYQQLTPAGLAAIGQAVISMAEAEGLQAHAEAVRVRMKSTAKNK